MPRTEVIETNAGNIQGRIEGGISVFKGIPYAEPPIGELRLREPVLKESWDGTFKALRFGPMAPQPPSGQILSPVFDEAKCLTLNIWTPALDRKMRPVMVWIHGGAFINGSGAYIDGKNLSLQGDVIVVSINYRLGALANLIIPGAPGNLNMLDIITALTWLKNNIEFFGGDSTNITIFGESAGGQAVCVLMAMPKAKGLFNRGIAQSGRANLDGYTLSEKIQITEWMSEELNIKLDNLEEFQKLPVEKIMDASAKIEQKAYTNKMFTYFSPYIDNHYLPEHPLTSINKGCASDIDLIIGTNRDEWKFYYQFVPDFKGIEQAELLETLKESMDYVKVNKKYTNLIIDTYKKSRLENKLRAGPTDIVDAFLTDAKYRIPAILFAEAQSKFHKNTFMYLFSWSSPYKEGFYGAMHGLDVFFVFKNFFPYNLEIVPETEETVLLSERMIDVWTNFAKSGNPNCNNIPEWPRYETNKRATLVFDKEIRVWNDPLEKERKLWNYMNFWPQFKI
jgi:para-nitrobenzyl esterase